MLRVENLYAGYSGVPALHGLAFEAREGEIVTLVGSNGAGKTTTLRAISGLVRPSAGTITLFGDRLDQLKAHEVVTRGIAHVPEGRQLFGRLTVEHNLLLGAYVPDAKQRRAESLERVYTLFPRLRERRTQRAATLSGGEQQMCAIGRGLMLRPKLLMLDEPSLGIAPKLVTEIFESIRQINEDGMTVLLVEQNVVEALELAHRAYVLQTGSIIAAGTGQELLQSDLVRQAYLGM